MTLAVSRRTNVFVIVASMMMMPVSTGRSEESDAGQLRIERKEAAYALYRGQDVIWQFNYEEGQNVPCLHPLKTAGGRSLTWDSPADHPWHRALWFSWKYINGVNYWEYAGDTGKPAGRTRWSPPQIETRDDFSTRITMRLTYQPDDADQIALSEERVLEISAPDQEDHYTIDWHSVFVAAIAVTLDRTPPRDQSFGGYAGLSIRFAPEIKDFAANSDSGAITFNQGGRFRGTANAVDYGGYVDDQPIGVAIFDHPGNPRHPTPWYLIRSSVSNYVNASLLNDAPMKLEAGESLSLRYRIAPHPGRWNAERLRMEQTRFQQYEFNRSTTPIPSTP